MFWKLARWTFGLAVLICAFLALNHAMFSVMATAAPPTNQHPEFWAYEVYRWLGYSLALFSAAILIVLNLRKGFPYLKRKRNVLLLVIAMFGLLAPQVNHFFDVDRCLDQGGRWNYEFQVCEK